MSKERGFGIWILWWMIYVGGRRVVAMWILSEVEGMDRDLGYRMEVKVVCWTCWM
jgi:hypothetical protein